MRSQKRVSQMDFYFKFCCALLLSLGTVSLLQAQQQSPASSSPLTCRVLGDKGEELNEAQTFKASNLKRIPLSIVLRDSPLPLETATFSDVVPADPDRPVVEIAVDHIVNGAKRRVPVKLLLTGRGLDGNRQYLHAFLEIPVDAAKRSASIEILLQRARTDPKSTREQLKLLEQNKAAVIASLEQIYMENSVGDYELTCHYRVRRASGATVEFRSTPSRIQVVFEGNYYDKPGFGPTK